MRVIADFCLVPVGVGVSVSKEIAACERVLTEAGLKTRLHAYGTNIEGEWDDVFAAIKRCHEVVHAMGTPRISSNLRFGTRTDRQQTMENKIQSVEKKRAGYGSALIDRPEGLSNLISTPAGNPALLPPPAGACHPLHS